MMPGIQPKIVSKDTTMIGPQPLSITASGGRRIATINLRHPIIFYLPSVSFIVT
jgi:hypothetical protein